MIRIIFILLILVIAISCTPTQFSLNEMGGTNIIGCKILSELNSVEKISDNSVLMKPKSKLAMRVTALTQTESSFVIKLTKGDGINFAYRTTENSLSENRSLKIELSKTGVTITESGKILHNNPNVKLLLGQNHKLRCVNEGKNLKIYLDCDEITNIATNLPATEFIFAETHENTEAKLENIDIIEVLN